MSPEQEDRIKQRAYEIWEREGHPHGRGDVHWSMAIQEIRAEDGWVDDAADSAGPTDDLSRQLGSAEAALASEGTGPAESAPEEPAPAARKPRAKKAAVPKVEAPTVEAAEETTEIPKPKARKSASPKSATAKSAAATKEAVEKPKRAAKVKA
jgi:outer membrane biosynthesis protein TonB